jgi:hypothetical protein
MKSKHYCQSPSLSEARHLPGRENILTSLIVFDNSLKLLLKMFYKEGLHGQHRRANIKSHQGNRGQIY